MIKARKEANLTQAKIAERLGKPQSYIAKIEGKDRKMDVLEFTEICEIIGIEASELIKILVRQKNL